MPAGPPPPPPPPPLHAALGPPEPPTSNGQRLTSIFIPRDDHGFRLRVAVVMALVSLASAYVTYTATEFGSTAAALNSAASQQLAQEQQSEQQIDAWVDQDLSLTARLDEPLQTYRQASEQAQAVRQSDPARAAQLDLQAQASWDNLRQLYAFLHLPGYLDLSGQTAAYDADGARTWSRVTDWRLFGGSSEQTRQQAAVASSTTDQLVLIVVVLVTALFVLTLAHVVGRRRGLPLAIGGGVLALTAVVGFALIDRDAVPLLLAVGAALIVLLVVLALAGHDRRALLGLEESMVVVEIARVPSHPHTTASTDPDQPPSSRYTRFAAIGIALITLLGALVGYLHVGAASAADSASWQGRDLGVQAIGALRAAEEGLSVKLQTYELGLVERGRAWDATQQAGYDGWAGDAATASRLREAAGQWARLADLSMDNSGLVAQLGSSGVPGNGELGLLHAAAWAAAARLAGAQDAANAAAQSAGERASVDFSVLAWLAVAAYLLGLSLVFREPSVRSVLASGASLLILAGIARTGGAWLLANEPSQATADQAASAYADGFVALAQQDWATAEIDFSQAISLRPDFGLAHRDRAEAILSSGSVQGVGLHSVFTADAVDRALADLDAASRAGTKTDGVLLNEGALLFHRAVLLHSTAVMGQSVDATRQGLTQSGAFANAYGLPHLNQVIGESNLALALLGLGRQAEAEAAYRQFVADTQRLPAGLRGYVVSAALTALDILVDGPVPPAPAMLSSMKALVIGRAYGAAVDSPARLTGAHAELFASTFQWRATMPAFDPKRDTLVAEWSRLDPATGRWSVLPLASGLLILDQVTAAGELGRDASPDGYFGRSSNELLDTPPRCMPPGRYRVELYLNGVLADSAGAEWTSGEYTPVLARDVGVAMCRPSDWQPVGVEAGYSTGFVSADGSRGMVVYRLHQPLAPAGADSRTAALDRLLASGAAGLPAGLDAGHQLDAAQQPTLLGTHGGIWRLSSYPGGRAKIIATLASVKSGVVLLTCLYGPESWIDSSDAGALLVSLSEYGG